AGLRGPGLPPGSGLPPAYEIEAEVTALLADSEVVLRLGDTVALYVNPTRGTLVLDRSGAPATATHPLPRTDRAVATVPGGVRSRLRVLVDGPLLELFLDERAMLTEKIYPAPEGPYTVETVRGRAATEVRGWTVV
ncbi:GH32 C-terminal domain-containing protein, partial [Streptomyces sp. ZG43]